MEKFMSNENPRFKRIDDVSDITGMGKSTILAWESQGRFPKAVRLSPTFRVWLEADVHKWMLAKHAEIAGINATVEA
jgi:prophage regulatory protein